MANDPNRQSIVRHEKRVYLDYQSTTPVDPRVLEAMLPFFTESFGNPSSVEHAFGTEAMDVVDGCRSEIAATLNVNPGEIVFTSGATESINLAIKGVALASGNKRRHFITVATEHKAVLECFRWLDENGFATTVIPVDHDGLVDPQQIAAAIRPETILVCVMAANNEIGVLQPVDQIGNICRKKGVYFFSDAAQALGKISIDAHRLQIDLLAGSGHKIYGPKGVGFLYVRRQSPHVKIEAIIHGGGHEGGLRSGTSPTPNIVGLSKALKLSIDVREGEQARIRQMRDHLLQSLKAIIPDLKVNGSLNHRLPGNLNITIPGIKNEALMILLRPQLAISSGSACGSSSGRPSHVLAALGLSTDESESSFRFSLGRFTNPADIEAAIQILASSVMRIRNR